MTYFRHLNRPCVWRAVVCGLACLLSVACAGSPGAADQAVSEQPEQRADESDEPATDVDPDEPPEGFESMDVFRVVPTGEGAAVVLVDAEERIVVPIFVGRTIAMTIQLRLERRRYARPLTHDLLDEIVEQLGGEVTKVHIDDVKSGIFVGTVFVRDASGELMTFDSRSSDAIAMAVGHDVPIFVSRSVIQKAGVDTEQFDGEQVPSEELPDGPQTQPL